VAENYRTTDERTAHATYERMHATKEFHELRRRYRGFAIPWTVAFLVWYLTYVVLSTWATDFMNTKLAGNINIALVFGLLQFVTTFLIAWLYAKHSAKHLDPLANQLKSEFDTGAHS
jgi:uncharacterized membrane protein (DUF485 family)